LMREAGGAVLPFLPSPRKSRFRNKLQLPLKMGGDRLRMGFYKPGTHEIMDFRDCPVQDKRLTRAALLVKRVLGKYPLPIYNEDRHTGLLRTLFLRSASQSDLIHVALVATKTEGQGIRELARRLQSEFRRQGLRLSGLTLNINPDRTNVILGERETVLSGKAKLRERILGLDFHAATRSFLQTNPGVTEKMYQKAMEWLAPEARESGLDLFCGMGTLTLVLARRVKGMAGVDASSSAIQDAGENARCNGVKNARFFCRDLDRDSLEDLPAADFAVLDPPRQGCSEALLKYLVRQRIKRVVYISCNPMTLKRDLLLLREGGFGIRKIQPVDMFPYTRHVESMTLLAWP